MQPVYLTGHSRPVHKVMHNYDGDLLFTCSDDGTICMYDTHQLVRIGVFKVNESCRSIDVTKNSKYVVASATTVGINVYDIKTGKLTSQVNVPGLHSKQVSLSFGDDLCFCLHDVEKRSYIRIFNMAEVMAGTSEGAVGGKGVKEIHTLEGSKDYQYTQAVWGPRNQSLLIGTTTGKVLYYDIESASIISEEPVHSDEIFSLSLTHDFTMLFTGSRDGTSKLLNPETLNVIRTFNYGKPCRTSSISPLWESTEFQKFHVILAGGQDAKDVTTTSAESGGFEMKMYNVIFNEKLSEVHGHFGPVHSTSFSPDGFSFASGAEDGYVHYHRFPPEYFSKKFE